MAVVCVAQTLLKQYMFETWENCSRSLVASTLFAFPGPVRLQSACSGVTSSCAIPVWKSFGAWLLIHCATTPCHRCRTFTSAVPR